MIFNVLSKSKQYAEVAELADAQASGACGSNIVWVQVPSSALHIYISLTLQTILQGFFVPFSKTGRYCKNSGRIWAI